MTVLSPPPLHRSGLDIENIRARANIGERHRIRAGHPDLCAERRQLVEQRGAAAGIEMGDDFIQQQ